MGISPMGSPRVRGGEKFLQLLKIYCSRKNTGTELYWRHEHANGGLDGTAYLRDRSGGGRGATGAQEAADAPAVVRHGNTDVHGAGLRRGPRDGDRRGVRGIGKDGLQLLPHQRIADPGPPGVHDGLPEERPDPARSRAGRGGAADPERRTERYDVLARRPGRPGPG